MTLLVGLLSFVGNSGSQLTLTDLTLQEIEVLSTTTSFTIGELVATNTATTASAEFTVNGKSPALPRSRFDFILVMIFLRCFRHGFIQRQSERSKQDRLREHKRDPQDEFRRFTDLPGRSE